MSPLDRRVLNQGRTDNPFDNFAIGADKEADWPSLRTLGDGPFQAAKGSHSHAGGGQVGVRKSADETVVSSTTLQDDDDLTMSFGNSEVWKVEFTLFWDGPVAADIKIGPTGTAYDLLVWGIHAVVRADDAQFGRMQTAAFEESTPGSESTLPVGTAGQGNRTLNTISAYIATSAAGSPDLTLQWAQNSISAGSTVMRRGSMMTAWRIA